MHELFRFKNSICFKIMRYGELSKGTQRCSNLWASWNSAPGPRQGPQGGPLDPPVIARATCSVGAGYLHHCTWGAGKVFPPSNPTGIGPKNVRFFSFSRGHGTAGTAEQRGQGRIQDFQKGRGHHWKCDWIERSERSVIMAWGPGPKPWQGSRGQSPRNLFDFFCFVFVF